MTDVRRDAAKNQGRPQPVGLGAELEFALQHEDLDLRLLKRRFLALAPEDVAAVVRARPKGVATRRLWFLYEQLLGRRLDLPDAPKMAAVQLLDPQRYITVPGVLSVRHRVYDNALGGPDFNPIIRRTPEIDAYLARDLGRRTRDMVIRVSPVVAAQVAGSLLMAECQATFAIEGEHPTRDTLLQWGRSLLEAERPPVALRTRGTPFAQRDRPGHPTPDFIGARPEDLPALVQGLFDCADRMRRGEVDPVLQAAALAFGFLYMQPLAHGNGPAHRALIHQVLAHNHFAPAGFILPLSAVMADRPDEYRAAYEAHLDPLMPLIDWHLTEAGDIAVNHETADLYRFVDCTRVAEFVFACVARSVDIDLPNELDYIQAQPARGVEGL